MREQRLGKNRLEDGRQPQGADDQHEQLHGRVVAVDLGPDDARGDEVVELAPGKRKRAARQVGVAGGLQQCPAQVAADGRDGHQASDRPDELTHQLRRISGRFGSGGGEHSLEPLEDSRVDGLAQSLLGPEVEDHQGCADAGRGSDGAHRGGPFTFLRQALQCGLQNPVTGVRRRQIGHRTQRKVRAVSGRPATLVELRVLEGPNVFFPRPAIKVVLDVSALVEAASALASSLAPKPGEPGTVQRHRWVAKLAAAVLREIAGAAGTARLGVRARPAHDPSRLVLAYPWRRRGPAEALAVGVAAVLEGLAAGGDRSVLVADAVGAVREAPVGAAASVRRPGVPTVGVTGTNGKTTTSRLIAHLGRTAGRSVAWTSTDGVYLDGVALERGDWSGPGGAALALDQPGIGLAVLETARGGILLRGMAVAALDVGVVTNVAADHLGLQDIHTVDELAEVKAVVARVVKPGGWVVLNGDDPRVLAMRSLSRGRPFVFSLDPHSPGLRVALDAGGRGATVADGALCLVERHGDLEALVSVLDVPLTLSGLSPHNTANALAALCAGLALGLPREAVVEGLRSFEPDTALNPGRMNLWDLDGVVVIVDLAHNEDGLRALLQVARGLVQPDGAVRLVAGTAGDRTDEILTGIGHIAVHGASDVVVADKPSYLRDRDPAELHQLISTGAGQPLERFPDELSAVNALIGRATSGDVVAVMCHEQLEEIGDRLSSLGAKQMTATAVASRVRSAQGAS